jgi:hypothetical protein
MPALNMWKRPAKLWCMLLSRISDANGWDVFFRPHKRAIAEKVK